MASVSQDVQVWARAAFQTSVGLCGFGAMTAPHQKERAKKNRHTNIEYFVVFRTADFNFCGCFGLDGPLGGRVFTSEVDI